jgi:hypothetical protein
MKWNIRDGSPKNGDFHVDITSVGLFLYCRLYAYIRDRWVMQDAYGVRMFMELGDLKLEANVGVDDKILRTFRFCKTDGSIADYKFFQENVNHDADIKFYLLPPQGRIDILNWGIKKRPGGDDGVES